MRTSQRCAMQGIVVCSIFSIAAAAQNSILPGTPISEFPTFQTLSIKLPITGDDNRNATVGVRISANGNAWRSVLPLLRVMPETVQPGMAVPSFAGSIFDLRPGFFYDIELNVSDPDGGGKIFVISAQTRKLPPVLPATPRYINVNTTLTFAQAYASANPGDVITLADGVYNLSEFWTSRSGTPTNPIIVRGANADKVILDGGNCACIMFGIGGTGNWIIEDLTFRNIQRAVRITSSGSNFVLRRIRTINVYSPVFSTSVQSNVTVMDSVFDGPSVWPQTNASTPNDYLLSSSAVSLAGSGHIIAHNRFQGFGDSVRFTTQGNRGQDIYGNDFYDVFDNAIELDFTAGNTKAYRNRITNSFMPLSVQPVYGGPAYIFRNVMLNEVHEPIKFHAVSGSNYSQSSGVWVFHNTSINSGYVPLGVETPDATHNFRFQNNIFLGRPSSPYALSWGTAVDQGLFDYNLYFPDAPFWWRDKAYTSHYYPNLAALKAATSEVMERNGLIASSNATLGMDPILTYNGRQAPRSLSLPASSPAIDKGLILANINDGFTGARPDMGALEVGCELPWYGPRPKDLTEAAQLRGCERDSRVRTGTAGFVKSDTVSKGDWRGGGYGTAGYVIAGDATSTPGATVSVKGNAVVWQATTTDPKGLVRAASSTRILAGWTTYQDLYLNVTLPVGTARQVALYFAEVTGPLGPRKLEITIVDKLNRILETRVLDNVAAGTYLVWNVTGDLKFKIMDHSPGGAGAALNGVFLQ